MALEENVDEAEGAPADLPVNEEEEAEEEEAEE